MEFLIAVMLFLRN